MASGPGSVAFAETAARRGCGSTPDWRFTFRYGVMAPGVCGYLTGALPRTSVPSVSYAILPQPRVTTVSSSAGLVTEVDVSVSDHLPCLDAAESLRCSLVARW